MVTPALVSVGDRDGVCVERGKMTYGAFSTRDGARYAHRPDRERSYTLICAMALTLGGGVGAALLYANEPATLQVAADAQLAVKSTIIPLIVMPIAAPAVQIARADPMFDPTLSTASTTFAQTAALGSGFALLSAPAILPPPGQTAVVASAEPVSNEEEPVAVASVAVTPDAPEVSLPPVAVPVVPLPMPRPAFQTDAVPLPRSASGRRSIAALTQPADASVAPSGPKSFFDTMFGASRPPATVLAYAAPEDRGLGRPIAIPARAPEAGTALYDISAHTVTLPNGTRLEAHSGLGPRLDDPRSVTEHMRGATPPNVYDLTLRETPFHGVRALRLNPVAGTTFGRGGLLAHTFMLGPRGDSNGCVVFRNYAAFLQAYESGQIRRLMVVARS